MRKRIKQSLVIISFILMILISPMSTKASGGIAVTGTFADYHYKLLPGEVIETPDVFIIFFNNFAVDIEVELTTSINNLDGSPSTVGDRVSFLLEDTLIEIPANSSIRIPIGIEVSEDAPAGDYRLGLAAQVIPDNIDGITVTGSAELRTRMSIFGEAGDLEIRTFDIFGEALPAQLRLFRRDGSSTVPVRTVNNGIIIDRFVPGDYLVVGTFKDYEVLREEFTIVDREQTVMHIVAQTVFIEDMTVTPLISTNTGLLSRVRINYTLRNIHTMVEDVRLILNTSFEDDLIDRGEEAIIPFLPESVFEGSFNYLPPEGWESGNYTFKIDVFQGLFTDENSLYLGESRERSLFVPEEFVSGEPSPRGTPVDEEPIDDDPFDEETEPEIAQVTWFWWLIGLIVVGLFGFLIFILWSKKDHLDAVEYASKKMLKAKYKPESEHFKTIINLVEKTMGPGTKFLNEVKGEKAYYQAVDEFLKKHQAFTPDDEKNALL